MQANEEAFRAFLSALAATKAGAGAGADASVKQAKQAKKRPLAIEPEMDIRGAHSRMLRDQPMCKRQVTEEYLLEKADAHLKSLRLAKAAAEAAEAAKAAKAADAAL
jgi:hypothetical protein